MSESMDAEDVSEIMNALWKRVDEVIAGHGGRVDKHVGDAVMAVVITSYSIHYTKLYELGPFAIGLFSSL